MRALKRPLLTGLLIAAAASSASAQGQPFYSHDNHTEYALLDPATHQFAIVYFVTERRAGATVLLNQTRSGSAGSDISVVDPRTGEALKFEYLSGAELTADGTPGRFDPQEHYIRAHLPRPVPEGGEGRVKILKTYQDEKSYYTQGSEIVFARSLGIARNAIVLPAGYSLVSSNVAAQILTTLDGRVKVSFEHGNGYPADVTIRARKNGSTPRPAVAIVDRGFDFSKTLYDLGDPARHAASFTYEYLETQPGSTSRLAVLDAIPLQAPTVVDVDTAKPLTVSGAKGTRVVTLDTPVAKQGQTARLRVTGTLSDAKYWVDGAELVWEGTLIAPRNTIVLPAGWDVSAVSVPATVSSQEDGRIVIQIFDGRPQPGVDVTIRAVKRP